MGLAEELGGRLGRRWQGPGGFGQGEGTLDRGNLRKGYWEEQDQLAPDLEPAGCFWLRGEAFWAMGSWL